MASNSVMGSAKNQAWPLFVAIFGVIALAIFALFMILSDYSEPESAAVPATVGKGRAWAIEELNEAGFEEVRTYDSWGRDRDSEDHEWKVCFQTPSQRARDRDETVYLGSARVDEPCPSREVGDQGWPRAPRGVMPDMTRPMSRTAFMARADLGEQVSFRLVDARRWPERYELVDDDADLGEWWVCWQDRPPGFVFTGQPVHLLVLPYGTDCSGFLDRAGERLDQYERQPPPPRRDGDR